MKISKEEILKKLHEMDLEFRPNIIFVNPEDFEEIKNAIPEIEKKCILEKNNCIERGKMYLMKRKDLEI